MTTTARDNSSFRISVNHRESLNVQLEQNETQRNHIHIYFTASLAEIGKELNKLKQDLTIFISYAWERNPVLYHHQKQYMKDFVEYLSFAGFQRIIHDGDSGSSLKSDLLNDLETNCDFILLFGTPSLVEKLNDETKEHVVKLEMKIINQKLEKPDWKTRIIPILVRGNREESIPAGEKWDDMVYEDFSEVLDETRRNIGYEIDYYDCFFKLLMRLHESTPFARSFIQKQKELFRRQVHESILFPPLPSSRSSGKLKQAKIFGAPPEVNSGFTGREAELKRIRESLGTFTRVCKLVICGLGGIGKTQLAAAYIHQHKHAYQLIAWFRSEFGITELMRQLGSVTLGLDLNDTSEKTMIQRVCDYLNNHSGWLLVFDNVENEAALPQLPSFGGGHILITTQNQKFRPDSISIEIFTRAKSVELLRKLMSKRKIVVDDELYQLADALGDFPLALNQAGSQLNYSPTLSIVTFTENFKQYLADTNGNSNDYEKTIFSTLQFALTSIKNENLEGMGETTVNVLNYLSFIGAEKIPLLLIKGFLAELLNCSMKSKQVENAISIVIGNLTGFSFVTQDGDDMYKIHRLLQTVIQETISDQNAVIRNMLIASAKLFHGEFYTKSERKREEAFAKHIFVLYNSAMERNISSSALFEVGYKYCRSIKYVQLEKSKALCSELIKYSHRILYSNETVELGRLLRLMGMLQKSATDVRRTLEMIQNVAPGSLESIKTKRILAEYILSDVNLNESAKLLKEALEELELLPESSEKTLQVLWTANAYATTLRSLHEDQESLYYYNLVLEIAKKEFHPEKTVCEAITESNLSILYQSENDLIAAEVHMLRSLDAYKEIFEDAYNSTILDCSEKLIAIARKGGDIEKTSKYEESLTRLKERFIQENPYGFGSYKIKLKELLESGDLLQLDLQTHELLAQSDKSLHPLANYFLGLLFNQKRDQLQAFNFLLANLRYGIDAYDPVHSFGVLLGVPRLLMKYREDVLDVVISSEKGGSISPYKMHFPFVIALLFLDVGRKHAKNALSWLGEITPKFEGYNKLVLFLKSIAYAYLGKDSVAKDILRDIGLHKFDQVSNAAISITFQDNDQIQIKIENKLLLDVPRNLFELYYPSAEDKETFNFDVNNIKVDYLELLLKLNNLEKLQSEARSLLTQGDDLFHPLANYYLGKLHFIQNEENEAFVYVTEYLENRIQADNSPDAHIYYFSGILKILLTTKEIPEKRKRILEIALLPNNRYPPQKHFKFLIAVLFVDAGKEYAEMALNWLNCVSPLSEEPKTLTLFLKSIANFYLGNETEAKSILRQVEKLEGLLNEDITFEFDKNLNGTVKYIVKFPPDFVRISGFPCDTEESSTFNVLKLFVVDVNQYLEEKAFEMVQEEDSSEIEGAKTKSTLKKNMRNCFLKILGFRMKNVG